MGKTKTQVNKYSTSMKFQEKQANNYQQLQLTDLYELGKQASINGCFINDVIWVPTLVVALGRR
jgi:hypothetical protein